MEGNILLTKINEKDGHESAKTLFSIKVHMYLQGAEVVEKRTCLDRFLEYLLGCLWWKKVKKKLLGTLF